MNISGAHISFIVALKSCQQEPFPAHAAETQSAVKLFHLELVCINAIYSLRKGTQHKKNLLCLLADMRMKTESRQSLQFVYLKADLLACVCAALPEL